MNAQEMRHVDWEELVHLPVLYGDGQVVGDAGVHPDVPMVGEPQWIDGWSINFFTVMARMNPRFIEQAIGVRPDEVRDVAMPVIAIELPDYPTEGGKTYLLPLADAARFVETLSKTVEDGLAFQKRLGRRQETRVERERREQAAALSQSMIHCAEDNCRRERVFFDDDGNGYCKRHAEARGIRPKGKHAR